MKHDSRPPASDTREGEGGYTAFADAVFAPLYPWLCRDVEAAFGRPLEGLRILEIGGGPGHMAVQFLARKPSLLIELDISMEMLSQARRRLHALGIPPDPAFSDTGVTSPRIAFLRGSPESIPLPAASVDLVFSRGSAQFWRDLPAALRDIRRVAAAEGMVYIGGGYGLSTPESLKNEMLANRERYFQKRSERRKEIPFLEMDQLLETARSIGGSPVLLGSGRGMWLKWLMN